MGIWQDWHTMILCFVYSSNDRLLCCLIIFHFVLLCQMTFLIVKMSGGWCHNFNVCSTYDVLRKHGLWNDKGNTLKVHFVILLPHPSFSQNCLVFYIVEAFRYMFVCKMSLVNSFCFSKIITKFKISYVDNNY